MCFAWRTGQATDPLAEIRPLASWFACLPTDARRVSIHRRGCDGRAVYTESQVFRSPPRIGRQVAAQIIDTHEHIVSAPDCLRRHSGLSVPAQHDHHANEIQEWRRHQHDPAECRQRRYREDVRHVGEQVGKAHAGAHGEPNGVLRPAPERHGLRDDGFESSLNHRQLSEREPPSATSPPGRQAFQGSGRSAATSSAGSGGLINGRSVLRHVAGVA